MMSFVNNFHLKVYYFAYFKIIPRLVKYQNDFSFIQYGATLTSLGSKVYEAGPNVPLKLTYLIIGKPVDHQVNIMSNNVLL